MDKKIKKVIDEAKWVVDAFDQADTGRAIRDNPSMVASRRDILVDAVDDLRAALKANGTPSILPNVKDGRPDL